MKKAISSFIVAVLMLLTSLPFSACRNTWSQPSKDLPDFMSNIEKTLNELKQQYPSYDYVHGDGYNFSAECWGDSDGTFAYYFYGTQDWPGIEEMAPLYGEKLRCAGIYTKTAGLFPIVNNGSLSIQSFFSSICVANYVVDSEDGPGMGWIFFDYMGYSVAINAYCEDSAGNFISPKVIRGEFMLLITDDEIFSYNNKLYEEAFETLV